MLVLSRRKGEKIVVGDNLATIEVVEIRGDKVRLGIVADRNVPVYRSEILNRPPETEAKPAT